MLGRGLESLIPNKTQQTPAAPQEKHGAIFQIETDKVTLNPFQPRKEINQENLKELAASIREVGIIQPIIVSKVEKETALGTEVAYQLIAGQRRLEAAKMLGLPRVPAIVRHVPEEKQKLEVALVENIQRENLNPIEAARAYSRLQEEFNLTQREIAARLGKSRETISNTVRLLNLPTQIQEALSRNVVSEGQARLLLSVADPIEQQQLFDDIQRNNVSVRELKERVRGMGRSLQTTADRLPQDEGGLIMLERELGRILGASVKVKRDPATQKIAILFDSPTVIEEIIKKLTEEQS